MIETRESSVHGLGVFAVRRIAEGELVGRYEGRRYSAQQTAAKAWDDALTYLFAFSDGSVIDGSEGGNATRHLNHSCAPNCVAYEERQSRRKVISIYALASIEEGEELFLDYSLDAPDSDAAALQCRCFAARCRGTMVAPA